MKNLREQIDLLEEQANEAELLGGLACEVETRHRNRILCGKLRDEVQALCRHAASERGLMPRPRVRALDNHPTKRV